MCHLVRFGFNSGDADGILTKGCLYTKNISRVEFGFNSGDADGILTNGCLIDTVYRGSPELFKPDIKSMSETGVSFSSVWF